MATGAASADKTRNQPIPPCTATKFKSTGEDSRNSSVRVAQTIMLNLPSVVSGGSRIETPAVITHVQPPNATFLPSPVYVTQPALTQEQSSAMLATTGVSVKTEASVVDRDEEHHKQLEDAGNSAVQNNTEVVSGQIIALHLKFTNLPFDKLIVLGFSRNKEDLSALKVNFDSMSVGNVAAVVTPKAEDSPVLILPRARRMLLTTPVPREAFIAVTTEIPTGTTAVISEAPVDLMSTTAATTTPGPTQMSTLTSVRVVSTLSMKCSFIENHRVCSSSEHDYCVLFRGSEPVLSSKLNVRAIQIPSTSSYRDQNILQVRCANKEAFSAV